MTQVIALKVAWSLCAFIWAFVSLELRFGVVITFIFCVIALILGASAAKDLARLSDE